MAQAGRRRRTNGPTIHTIADAAGVSTATVSYVLNDRDLTDDRIRITPATRLRVLQTVDRLGYRANSMARAMRRGTTEQVCLALGHLDSPWTQAMIAAVSERVHRIGMTCLLLIDQNWQEFLARRGADGAVIHGSALTDDDVVRLRTLGERGVPVIALDCDVEPDGFDVVRQRWRPALEQAVTSLLGRHERLACLTRGGGDHPTDDRRYRVYADVLHRAGREIDPAMVRGVEADRYRAYRAALDLLDRPDRPTAVFAINDLAAISTLWAAHRLGISVPDELEVIGVGNSPEGVLADPPLSTVGPESVFGVVADLLVARLAHRDEPTERVHISDWSFYPRSTTREERS